MYSFNKHLLGPNSIVISVDNSEKRIKIERSYKSKYIVVGQ